MALMSATGTEKGWDQPLEAGAASWLVPASGLGEEALGSVPMKLGHLGCWLARGAGGGVWPGAAPTSVGPTHDHGPVKLCLSSPWGSLWGS